MGLLVFLSVYGMSAWWPWRPEEHVGSPAARVTMVVSCPVSAGIQAWLLWMSSQST